MVFFKFIFICKISLSDCIIAFGIRNFLYISIYIYCQIINYSIRILNYILLYVITFDIIIILLLYSHK